MNIFDFLYEPYSKPNKPKFWDTGEYIPEEVLKSWKKDIDPGFSIKPNNTNIRYTWKNASFETPQYRKLYNRDGSMLY